MSADRHSVTLHQQQGSISLRAFADREGMNIEAVKRYARSGWILGARQDARSKHWHIYPPAKLLKQPREYKRKAPGDLPDIEPLQLSEARPPAPLPAVFSDAKVRNACCRIRNEIARRYADGMCFLALSRSEFRQVYRAVEQERNRKRNAVGRGLVKVRELRETDTLWEILRRVNGRLT